MQPNSHTEPTRLEALVPVEINDLLEEQAPGRASASFRHAVRVAIVQVLLFEEQGIVSVSCAHEHHERVANECGALLAKIMGRTTP